MQDSLGDRFKNLYENPFRFSLPGRMPIVLRVDGKSFSSYTKSLQKPFDDKFIDAMDLVAIYLMQEIQGAQIAYTQSDEISILLNNYSKLETQPYLKNNIQKITSVVAGFASAKMTEVSSSIFNKTKLACFDCRVFVLPENEVNNYFLWRQLDASRNSVSMLAQSLFSHKELKGKNSKEMQEMIFQKSKTNWNDIQTRYKRGRCIKKATKEHLVENRKTGEEIKVIRNIFVVDNEIPRFNSDTNYIEQYLKREE